MSFDVLRAVVLVGDLVLTDDVVAKCLQDGHYVAFADRVEKVTAFADVKASVGVSAFDEKAAAIVADYQEAHELASRTRQAEREAAHVAYTSQCGTAFTAWASKGFQPDARTAYVKVCAPFFAAYDAQRIADEMNYLDERSTALSALTATLAPLAVQLRADAKKGTTGEKLANVKLAENIMVYDVTADAIEVEK